MDTVVKGVLLEKQIARDRAGENKAVVFGTCKVAEDAIGLIPMEEGGGANVAAELADDRGYVRAS